MFTINCCAQVYWVMITPPENTEIQFVIVCWERAWADCQALVIDEVIDDPFKNGYCSILELTPGYGLTIQFWIQPCISACGALDCKRYWSLKESVLIATWSFRLYLLSNYIFQNTVVQQLWFTYWITWKWHHNFVSWATYESHSHFKIHLKWNSKKKKR